MSDVSACCCCCSGKNQPVTTSGCAVCAATCATTGTLDTANALVANGANVIGAIFKAKNQQQATAVKAQVQLAQTQAASQTLIAIAVIAVIGFVLLARGK